MTFKIKIFSLLFLGVILSSSAFAWEDIYDNNSLAIDSSAQSYSGDTIAINHDSDNREPIIITDESDNSDDDDND